MYLIIKADKDSYDRKIDINLENNFPTAEEASDELREILVSWLLYKFKDDKLLEELNYDYDLYEKRLMKKIKTRITKTINNGDICVMYDSYEINYDEFGNLTMITTGCPSSNEYDGETWQVIYI